MDIFVEACERQYLRSFDMLRQALELCPDELWAAEGDDVPFWRQAYHTLMVTEGYATAEFETVGGPAVERVFGGLREPGPGEPSYLPRVEALGALMDAGQAPTGVLGREEALAYLESVVEDCRASLERDATRDPSDPASNPFPWTGSTVYDKHMYNLRHLHHHLGRMNGFLRRRADIGNPWVMEGGPPSDGE